jgi:hypothetical protein
MKNGKDRVRGHEKVAMTAKFHSHRNLPFWWHKTTKKYNKNNTKTPYVVSLIIETIFQKRIVQKGLAHCHRKVTMVMDRYRCVSAIEKSRPTVVIPKKNLLRRNLRENSTRYMVPSTVYVVRDMWYMVHRQFLAFGDQTQSSCKRRKYNETVRR